MARAPLPLCPEGPREGFAPIDWSAPIDLASSRATLPSTAVIKGLFIDGVLKSCARRDKPLAWPKKYVAFKEYPTAEYMDVCEAAATRLFPGESMREGLRRVGRMAYPDLAASLIGRVVFGVLGKDICSISKHVSKAYDIAGNPGRAVLVQLWENASLVRLENVYSHLDTVQVGAFEGAVHACDLDCEIQLRPITHGTAEFFTRWWPRP